MWGRLLRLSRSLVDAFKECARCFQSAEHRILGSLIAQKKDLCNYFRQARRLDDSGYLSSVNQRALRSDSIPAGFGTARVVRYLVPRY